MTTAGRVLAALFVLGLTARSGKASAAELSATASLVSDYRYRGLSLSAGKPALQGSLDADLANGFHTGIWASSIREDGKTRAELDLSFGKDIELGRQLSLDLSTTLYAYPSRPNESYGEASASLALERGPITGKLGLSYAPPQRALRLEGGATHGNSYYFLAAEWNVPVRKVKMTAALGYERGPFDAARGGGKWDWSLGVEKAGRHARIGLAIVASSVEHPAAVGTLAFEL
jgi:uncharacterized protein (TIGR02001 family)